MCFTIDVPVNKYSILETIRERERERERETMRLFQGLTFILFVKGHRPVFYSKLCNRIGKSIEQPLYKDQTQSGWHSAARCGSK